MVNTPQVPLDVYVVLNYYSDVCGIEFCSIAYVDMIYFRQEIYKPTIIILRTQAKSLKFSHKLYWEQVALGISVPLVCL